MSRLYICVLINVPFINVAFPSSTKKNQGKSKMDHHQESQCERNTYPVLRGLEDKWVVGHDELFQELEVFGRKLGPGVHEPDILPHH